jgi:hypothetical protein
MLSLHVSGPAPNSFITQSKWVFTNWVCLHLLLSETVGEFRAHPVHCQRVQTQLDGKKPDFPDPKASSFKSVFFCKSFIQKSTNPFTEMHFTTAFPAALTKFTHLIWPVVAGQRVFCSF